MELEFELPDEWFFDGGDEAGEYMKFIRWVLGSREGELQDDILR